ncbi:MAG: universal stress protein [Desulfuromonadales bacterium]|nr:universal stress protein [Desulfuromonadales bacterium]
MERKGIKRILTPVDESLRSHRVVERAAEMAETFHAKIILLHVRQKVPDILGEPYYQKVLDKFFKKAEMTTAPLKKLLEESGVDHEVLILEGDPAQAIIVAAEDEKCDLIVMGTRGLSDFKGMALGSVSHKVLHAADCMVLLVP